METGIVVGIHGAFVGDCEDGRESAHRVVYIRTAGDGTLSPEHAREFAACVLRAAERAEGRNTARSLAREARAATGGRS